MEVFYFAIIWFMMWYIIKTKRELSEYRKFFSQNNNIYVPSYKEIIEDHHWSVQLLKAFNEKFQSSKRQNNKLAIPALRKRISSIGLALIGKRD